MSDHKPIENFSDEDMQALLELLERLGKRDEVRRYQERMRAQSHTPSVEEEETETVRPVPLGFPHSSVGKESACHAGDPGLIPWSRRSTREGIGYPLQFS